MNNLSNTRLKLMTRLVLHLLALVFFAHPVIAAVKPPQEVEIEGIPPLALQTTEGLARYNNTRAARLVGWMGNQGIVVLTRFGNTVQVHWVKEPLGIRNQLTFRNEPVRFATTSPDPSFGIVYGLDTGGAEGYQLFYLDPLTANSRQLKAAGPRNTDPIYTRDGRSVAYSTTAANGRDSHIYFMDLQSEVSRPVIERTGTWYPLDFSIDDQKLLVANYNSISDIKLYEVEIQSRKVTRLGTDPLPASQTLARYAPDNSGLWFLSDLDTDVRSLRFRDAITSEVTDITSERLRHDIENFDISYNGNLLAMVVNIEGRDQLRLYDTRRNREIGVPASLNEIATRIFSLKFSKDGRSLALSLASPSMPGDIFVLDIRRKKLQRWTNSELGEIKHEALRSPKLIKFATFDTEGEKGNRRLIPAYYYPVSDRFTGVRPVVINIHGGPERQARPVFNSLVQYLVNELGIAVIYPNVRGSSGYGRNYMALDDVFKRENAVKDVGALLDWISTQPELDTAGSQLWAVHTAAI